MPDEARVNLFDFDRKGLELWFEALGEKSFRAHQLMRWIYHRDVLDFDCMTDFSKALRVEMAKRAQLRLPEIVNEQISKDGTRKWLVATSPDNCVEMVLIPEQKRATLCLSSQIGCALACSFCATGSQGFNGNLTAGQIIGQLYLACQRVKGSARISNLVFMGMGEPLLNLDAVLPAVNIAMDDLAFGLSRRRVTLSTAGVVPAIRQLAEVSRASLAVSLHAPEDSLRDILVPLNKKYPIAQLLDACQIYGAALGKSREVTIEYILIRGVNDSDEHWRKLSSLLRDLPCKINLIPFNAFAGSDYQAPLPARVQAFWKGLCSAGFRVTVRTERGADINAACGQLAGRFQDQTRRRLRHAAAGKNPGTQAQDGRHQRTLSVVQSQ